MGASARPCWFQEQGLWCGDHVLGLAGLEWLRVQHYVVLGSWFGEAKQVLPATIILVGFLQTILASLVSAFTISGLR